MNEQILKTKVLKATAVRQAMFEVIGENRDEIVKRARAKLVAMGIEFTDEDLTAMAGGTTPAAPARG